MSYIRLFGYAEVNNVDDVLLISRSR